MITFLGLRLGGGGGSAVMSNAEFPLLLNIGDLLPSGGCYASRSFDNRRGSVFEAARRRRKNMIGGGGGGFGLGFIRWWWLMEMGAN